MIQLRTIGDMKHWDKQEYFVLTHLGQKTIDQLHVVGIYHLLNAQNFP